MTNYENANFENKKPMVTLALYPQLECRQFVHTTDKTRLNGSSPSSHGMPPNRELLCPLSPIRNALIRLTGMAALS